MPEPRQSGPTAESITIPAPSEAVLRVLTQGVRVHISQYVRDGGSRDFRLEDAQDAANAWLDAVERARKATLDERPHQRGGGEGC